MSHDGPYTLETPESIELEFELAGPGSRFCAIVIDSLIQFLLVVSVVIAMLITNVQWLDRRRFGAAGDEWSAWLLAIGIVTLMGVLFAYSLLFELLMGGQTPGKRAMKIRVIRDDGTPASAMDIVVRNLIRVIDVLPGFYAVGGVVAFFNPLHKRLGDLAAGTIVVKEGDLDFRAHADKRYELAPQPSVPANVELTPDERRLLQGFLHRRTELLPQARRELADRLARPLYEKYGGSYGQPESYIQRLLEGRHHEP
jgi:uncharacterized RDD family membrane protein YckC